jgi:HSP20 family protein
MPGGLKKGGVSMLSLLERTPWAAFPNVASLHHDLDPLFESVMGETRWPAAEVFTPPADITRDADKWIIAIAIPGIAPEKVDIDVVGRLLRVRGERTMPAMNDDGVDPIVSEIRYGRFERDFTIPDDIDADHVEATYRYGILELRLPLNEHAKPRRIDVQTAPAVTQLSA